MSAQSNGAVEYVKNNMPLIGFGTYLIIEREQVIKAVKSAITAGYRFIDTAQVYRNEKFVGEALKGVEKENGIQRTELFITSKLHPRNNDQSSYECVKKSLKELQLDYLDLYLLHWPGKTKLKAGDPRNSDARKLAWQGLEKAYYEGLVKSIGISNYESHHIEELMTHCTVIPSVNQCEYHPGYCPQDIVECCLKHGIHFQAYSSLGTSDTTTLLDTPLFKEFAEKYNCTVPQLLLAWAISQGISVLPKSTEEVHMRQNLEVLSITITLEDIEKMKLEDQKKICWDPRIVR